MSYDLLATARELVQLLDSVRASGFSDEQAIQRAKALNMALAPVYDRIYGATPLIMTEYPAGVWWPRARERVTQALAALEGGVVVNGPSAQAAPAESTAIVRLRAILNQVDEVVADPGSRYFDPPLVLELVDRYARSLVELQSANPDLYGELPLRERPQSSGTTDYDGRGYIERSVLDQLRRDTRYCLDLALHVPPEAAQATVAVEREGAFIAGTMFDALKLVHQLIAGAAERIVLVDQYVDGSVLDLLSAKRRTVEVEILTGKLAPDVRVLAQAFKDQHGGLAIRSSKSFHDRFLRIDDDEWYHFGASIKDAGRRGFMFSRIEEPMVIEAMRTAVRNDWDNAPVII